MEAFEMKEKEKNLSKIIEMIESKDDGCLFDEDEKEYLCAVNDNEF